MSRPRLPLLGALAILLLATGTAQADHRDYAKGVEAAENGDWAKVQQLMNAAFADDATAQARARMYGTYYRPYLPQYYLALVAFQRKDCATVMRFLDDAGYKAVIAAGGRAAEEVTQDAAMRRSCATPITPPPPPPVATLTDSEKTEAARARDQLTQALTAAQRAQVPEAQLAPLRTRAESARRALDDALAKADGKALKAAIDSAAAIRSDVAGRTRAAEQLAVSSSSASSSSAAPPPVDSRPVAAPALRSALAAWLSGNYGAVIATRTAGMDAASTAHTALLRAAALHAQWVLGGERDVAQRDGAMAAIREARRAAPAIRPNERFFSPRFVAFFGATR